MFTFCISTMANCYVCISVQVRESMEILTRFLKMVVFHQSSGLAYVMRAGLCAFLFVCVSMLLMKNLIYRFFFTERSYLN